MDAVELRDPDDARAYLLQGLWLTRASRPAGAIVKPALEWVLELASGGHATLPVGFFADLGTLVY